MTAKNVDDSDDELYTDPLKNSRKKELKRAASEDFENSQQDSNKKPRSGSPSNLDPKVFSDL